MPKIDLDNDDHVHVLNVEIDELAQNELSPESLEEYFRYKAELVRDAEPKIEDILRGMITGCMEERYR
jgi:hypothetical protein